MFAITAAFGQTGRAACEALLSAGQPIRMIAHRHPADADAWRARGADIVVADLGDTDAVARAFDGATGAYLLNPPAYQHPDMFARAQAVHASLIGAARSAGVGHWVALSSVGAQQSRGTGNILTTHDFEGQLQAASRDDPAVAVTVLRAANFMENWAGALKPVLAQGVLPSLFLPLERKLPMVSALDIGRTAADLLLQGGNGYRVVELHGPAPVSPQDTAQALGELLDDRVQAVEADPARWAAEKSKAGMPQRVAEAFLEMFQGFNDGTVVFEGTHETRRGSVTLRDAMADALQRARGLPTTPARTAQP